MLNYKWLSVFNRMLTLFTLLMTLPAMAAVNVNKTRVIFNEAEMAQSILLSNDGEMPVVVQAWFDEGDQTSSPDINKTPVIATPPVFRVMPGEIKSLRLILTSRQALTAGRESLYWLNIYQITQGKKIKEKYASEVVLPLRLRLKTMVRPARVGKIQEQDGRMIIFLVKSGKLIITNPTNWHASMNMSTADGSAYNNLLIPPDQSISVDTPITLKKNDIVSYELINDTGNKWIYQGVVR